MEQSEETVEGKGRRRRAVKSFLTADRTPMWFTAFALLLGASGTYLIAPLVNSEFETQKIKTDFVIRNYNELREKMENFQGLYVATTQKQAAGEDIRGDVVRLQELTARVSAQNISMLPMFTTANGPKAAGQVTTAMNGMITVLFSNAGKHIETDEAVTAYNGEVTAATQALVPPLLELYVQIGRVGRLRPTAVGTDLKEE